MNRLTKDNTLMTAKCGECNGLMLVPTNEFENKVGQPHNLPCDKCEKTQPMTIMEFEEYYDDGCRGC